MDVFSFAFIIYHCKSTNSLMSKNRQYVTNLIFRVFIFILSKIYLSGWAGNLRRWFFTCANLCKLVCMCLGASVHSYFNKAITEFPNFRLGVKLVIEALSLFWSKLGHGVQGLLFNIFKKFCYTYSIKYYSYFTCKYI